MASGTARGHQSFLQHEGYILLLCYRDAVRIDHGKIALHGDRDIALCDIVCGLLVPILLAPFPDVVVRNDHVRLSKIGIPLIDGIVHHAGVAAAVAEGQHGALSDLPLHIDGLVRVEVLLDEAAGEHQLVAVFILEVHIGRLVLVPLLLDLEVRADHMLRADVLADGRVRYDGAGGRALRAADDPDLETVIIQVFHKLGHGQIDVVDVAHVFKACGVLFAEFDHILGKLFHSHAGVGLGEVPRQGLVGEVPRLDGRGHRL